jgi:hypothetical protein
MRTKRIDFSKLLFALSCVLVLTAVGTATHAANVTGTISDALSVYVPGGTIYIAAYNDPNSPTPVAGPVTITSLDTYTLPVGDGYNGQQLWVKARWDANGNTTRDGGDVGGDTPAIQ